MNKIKRQVTFAKRREGLLRKAFRSLRCQDALIIFSNGGKFMLKTIEMYQKCNYGVPEANVSTQEALVM
ncbi:MADS-box transcription factor 1, partial [Mucuna pruriens]